MTEKQNSKFKAKLTNGEEIIFVGFELKDKKKTPFYYFEISNGVFLKFEKGRVESIEKQGNREK